MFEGVVGSTALSDIAIDDVEFLENTKCTSTAETLGNMVGFELLRTKNISTKKLYLRFVIFSWFSH